MFYNLFCQTPISLLFQSPHYSLHVERVYKQDPATYNYLLPILNDVRLKDQKNRPQGKGKMK